MQKNLNKISQGALNDKKVFAKKKRKEKNHFVCIEFMVGGVRVF